MVNFWVNLNKHGQYKTTSVMYYSFGGYFKGLYVVGETVDILINSGFNHINLPVKISRLVTK